MEVRFWQVPRTKAIELSKRRGDLVSFGSEGVASDVADALLAEEVGVDDVAELAGATDDVELAEQALLGRLLDRSLRLSRLLCHVL